MPLLIVISRIFDVSLGTLRVVFIAKGLKKWAPLVGFFEVLIWIIVIRQLFSAFENPIWYVAYAAGFALGTYLGIYMSEKFSTGEVLVRVITHHNTTILLKDLREKGFGVTAVDSQDGIAKTKVIFTVIPEKFLKEVIKTIKSANPKAFYTIESIRRVNEGIFPAHKKREPILAIAGLINGFRKGK